VLRANKAGERSQARRYRAWVEANFSRVTLNFTLILSTLMIPVQIAFIPMFLIVARMPHVGGSGMLASHVVTAFGIFLMR
jgi:ABC-type glycerol-3-phosphate transport system permease component